MDLLVRRGKSASDVCFSMSQLVHPVSIAPIPCHDLKSPSKLCTACELEAKPYMRDLVMMDGRQGVGAFELEIASAWQ